MKPNLKTTVRRLLAGIGAILAASPALAQTMVVDRGLPTANVNSGTANQSNVAWGDSESTANPAQYDVIGDSFTIGGSGNYTVTDIRVWEVNGPTTGLSLLGGVSGSTISTTPIDSSYTVESVTYANGQTYQGSSGNFMPIYQLDFKVAINLAAGQTFDFFLNGSYVSYDDKGYVGPFLASSAGQSGGGADGLMLLLNVNGSTTSVGTWNSQTGVGTSDWNGYPGWDKTSDANVEVFVPDGGSAFMLLGSSLAGLAWLRRRFGRG